ncbi:hypothetical protein V6N13_095505 [Hibiscus sabdariffa]
MGLQEPRVWLPCATSRMLRAGRVLRLHVALEFVDCGHVRYDYGQQLILSCLELCKDLEWQISHIPRECNSCADSLAKRGIRRMVDYCEVWQDP